MSHATEQQNKCRVVRVMTWTVDCCTPGQLFHHVGGGGGGGGGMGVPSRRELAVKGDLAVQDGACLVLVTSITQDSLVPLS